MSRLPLLMILLLSIAPAWAASTLSKNARHPSYGVATTDPGEGDLPVVRQQLRQSSAELQRLQRHVSSEESRSRQASERLRQQDQALEQLRRQLQALNGRSSAEEIVH